MSGDLLRDRLSFLAARPVGDPLRPPTGKATME